VAAHAKDASMNSSVKFPIVAYSLQVARDKLVSLGTCIGKLTHTGKFRLTIGALDILAAHAKYKVRYATHLAQKTWSSLALHPMLYPIHAYLHHAMMEGSL
jgi:hypothetical protein